jgi:CheY-like chemotaxis protein
VSQKWAANGPISAVLVRIAYRIVALQTKILSRYRERRDGRIIAGVLEVRKEIPIKSEPIPGHSKDALISSHDAPFSQGEPSDTPVRKLTISIPRGARVFLLDDDDVRIQWFLERLTSITVAKEARDAIAILDSYPPFDFVFLDHDLGLFTGTEGDGLQVAQHLAGRGFDSHNTVIHSSNTDGATAMKAALKNATVVPFGQFEIEAVA